MANIKKHLENIKGALFGKDVRSSIHDGIDAINKEVEGTTEKQNKLGEQFKNLVINEGNSNAEVAASRGSHDWLPDRLDNFDSQLEQSVQKVVASKIGMIANDISKSKENTNVLSNAINKGYSIIIDDNYYIDSIGVELHGDIHIEGMSNKGALLFNNVTSSCFYINDFSSIVLKNIKIQNNEE